MPEPKKIIVCSLKGGVGKTTICLDIARVLRNQNYQIGLLDVDIHASALPRALHLDIPPGYEPQMGGKLQPLTFKGYKLFSIGLLFPEKTANLWDGPTKREAVRQIATSSVDWGNDLDFLIVDSPPTVGDEVQSLLTNLTNIYGAIIVCQPNDLAILALAKSLDALTEISTPIAGIIANMVGYRCPHCGEVSNPFDRTADDIVSFCREIGVSFLGAVPLGTAEDRLPNIEHAVGVMFRNTPVILPKYKGGLARWLMARILT